MFKPVSSLLQSENADGMIEQEIGTLTDHSDALSLVTIVENQVAEQVSLSAESSETQIFMTLRHKENLDADGS